MIVGHKDDIERVVVNNPAAEGATMKVAISPKEGWDGYVLRIFEVEAGGYTPKHVHPWPHINYVIGGKGILYLDGKDYDLEAGSYAYVPSSVEHQFRNPNDEKIEFICIVPEEGHV